VFVDQLIILGGARGQQAGQQKNGSQGGAHGRRLGF
jgi:hypothetical protein